MKLKDFDFRIWDNEDKLYLEQKYTKKLNCFEAVGYAVGLVGNGQIKSVYEIVTGVNSTQDGLDDYEWVNNLGENKWEIELFTGLYDKNGKKIYEGDIIDINADPFIFKDIVCMDMIRGIELKESNYHLCNVIENFTYGDYIDEIEVIGNIHNNHI